MWRALTPVIRHFLQLLAGWLVAQGVLDDEGAVLFVGAITSAGSLLWWQAEKRGWV